MKNHQKEPVQTEGVFYPVSKESTILSFYMEMRQKEDLEGSEVGPESGTKDKEGIKEGVSNTASEENSVGGDFVVVSMNKTSISVIKGRGCTDTGYTVNEVVLVAQSSKVTLGEHRFEFVLCRFVCILPGAVYWYVSFYFV